MGAQVYWYVVPYETDVDAALQKLRERELTAGRYNPIVPFPEFPVDPNAAARTDHHASFEAAMEASGEDGTRSIIDMQAVSPEPGLSPMPDLMVHPLADDDLRRFFGSNTPTLEVIRKAHSFWDSISRGSGVYIVLQEDGKPRELFFAGFSFD